MPNKIESIFGDISITEYTTTNACGTTIWSSAYVLSHYLAKNREKILFTKKSSNNKAIRPFTMIELGSGTGMNSIILFHTLRHDIELDDSNHQQQKAYHCLITDYEKSC